jgi:hypothetical protein
MLPGAFPSDRDQDTVRQRTVPRCVIADDSAGSESNHSPDSDMIPGVFPIDGVCGASDDLDAGNRTVFGRRAKLKLCGCRSGERESKLFPWFDDEEAIASISRNLTAVAIEKALLLASEDEKEALAAIQDTKF